METMKEETDMVQESPRTEVTYVQNQEREIGTGSNGGSYQCKTLVILWSPSQRTSKGWSGVYAPTRFFPASQSRLLGARTKRQQGSERRSVSKRAEEAGQSSMRLEVDLEHSDAQHTHIPPTSLKDINTSHPHRRHVHLPPAAEPQVEP
jgi:hypothetical protein